MEYLVLGFFTGLSLILAIGAQNIFVIEQGLKKQYVFLVCIICSLSDLILIFLGILLFHFFHQYFNFFVELTLHASEHKLDNERHDVDMGNVSVPHFGVHLSRKDFDTLKNRLKENGAKYYDEPYLRFKGTKYEQETFFVKDPNENVLEIKTLTNNPD